MYSKDMLIGILLSRSKMDFHIEKADDALLGYRVRLNLILRAEEDFLLATQRSLLQHGIQSKYHALEHKARAKPILKIGGIKNLFKITELVPKLPDAKGEWIVFRQLVELISEGQHRTADGFDKILELKGLI
jgi:hypothetical protein|tara:strand:+ start:556 stop:951 length:396 start_codon:yes stop_codon:yes gene_type:complete